MRGKVVAKCPKCSKEEKFSSHRKNIRYLNGERYELHTCPICGERYLARTFGFHSILRFHGDDFGEQLSSILEITPNTEHWQGFLQQVHECTDEKNLLKVIRNSHGDNVKALSNAEYSGFIDRSLIITEDLWEQLEEI